MKKRTPAPGIRCGEETLSVFRRPLSERPARKTENRQRTTPFSSTNPACPSEPPEGVRVRRFAPAYRIVDCNLAQRDRVHKPDALAVRAESPAHQDRKSTRLNSSHVEISYAVFCLKKKKKKKIKNTRQKENRNN